MFLVAVIWNILILDLNLAFKPLWISFQAYSVLWFRTGNIVHLFDLSSKHPVEG